MTTAQFPTGPATPDGTVAGACHAEHTTGFTGKRLGRNTEHGAWQPCAPTVDYDDAGEPIEWPEEWNEG